MWAVERVEEPKKWDEELNAPIPGVTTASRSTRQGRSLRDQEMAQLEGLINVPASG